MSEYLGADTRAAPAQPDAAPAEKVKQGPVSKLAGKLQASPAAARAAVVALGALVLLVLVLVVYFRGVGPVGPFGAYAALRAKAPAKGAASRFKPAAGGPAAEAKARQEADPKDAAKTEKTETEELIDELNAD
ncbi:MAG: hypothetical protein EBU46_19680 [Nitrosomonadaceae bacterium]|nr:hypothetical protein [Nitrosomonadaceae bacterium]